MKKHLRAISVLLVIAVLTAVMGACAGADDPTPSNTSDTGNGAVVNPEEDYDDLEARQLVSDNVPGLDFEKAQFRTIVQESTKYDIWVEEESGDALDDEIYKRNRNIEERFNIEIVEAYALIYTQLSTTVRNSVNADEDDFDLVLGQMETSGQDATSGIFMNWYDIPYLNFAQPWYPKSIIENAATVNGKMYNMVSDLCISYAEQTWAMVYDKVRAASYGIPDIYPLVQNNEWTIDQLHNLTKDIYEDLNGNSAPDENDFYGFVTALNGCLVLSYFYGFDQRLVTVSEDYEIDMVLNCEKAVDIVEKLRSIYYDSPGVLNVRDASNAGIYNIFLKEQAIFAPIQLQYMYSQLRDYENDYGVVPFPKWNEAQEEYYSVCDAGSNVLSVPTTAQNLEMIGAVVEALSCYSWKTVLPTYYDIALEAKSTRDEESVEMLNIILDNRVIDFAYLYDGWNGWIFTLPNFISNARGFASQYESSVNQKRNHYQNVLDFFLEDQ